MRIFSASLRPWRRNLYEREGKAWKFGLCAALLREILPSSLRSVSGLFYCKEKYPLLYLVTHIYYPCTYILFELCISLSLTLSISSIPSIYRSISYLVVVLSSFTVLLSFSNPRWVVLMFLPHTIRVLQFNFVQMTDYLHNRQILTEHRLPIAHLIYLCTYIGDNNNNNKKLFVVTAISCQLTRGLLVAIDCHQVRALEHPPLYIYIYIRFNLALQRPWSEQDTNTRLTAPHTHAGNRKVRRGGEALDDKGELAFSSSAASGSCDTPFWLIAFPFLFCRETSTQKISTPLTLLSYYFLHTNKSGMDRNWKPLNLTLLSSLRASFLPSFLLVGFHI
eukprot:gene10137-7095_t